MVPYTIILPKFPGYLWASAKFPGDFRDFAKFPGCFQDVYRIVGWGWEISFPSLDFCTSSGRGTLFLIGKRKNPGWAMCKILP
jgi:hypothetical protein